MYFNIFLICWKNTFYFYNNISVEVIEKQGQIDYKELVKGREYDKKNLHHSINYVEGEEDRQTNTKRGWREKNIKRENLKGDVTPIWENPQWHMW